MSEPKDMIAPQYLAWVKRYGVAVQEYPRYHQHSSRPHQVDLLLLSFIVEGEARHQITDAEFAAGPGSVGITRYGESHMMVTDAKGIDVYNIYLDPRQTPLPLAPGALRRMQSLLFPEREGFRHQLNRSMHFQLEHPDEFLAVLRRIEREIADGQPGVEEVVRALLNILVISCCRAAQASGIHPAENQQATTPPWIISLCRRMDRHYDEAITLDDLCREAGLSRSYLCRSFKHHVGVPPGEYLLQRRLEAARLALRGSGDKILSVAMGCGFNDISHFNRLFKARFGLTPSAYRAGRREQ